MLIAVYGTLRQNQCRNHALNTSQFMGMYRLKDDSALLIQTPGGFPAYVSVRHEYIVDLCNNHESWWEDYKEKYSDVVDPVSRTLLQSGLDSPLVEVYNITPTVCTRLDIIENVPGLYNRSKISIVPVYDDTVTLITTTASWRESLNKASSSFTDAMRYGANIINDDLSCPTMCYIYYIDPMDTWIQGSPIIWNGNFSNPIINKDAVFNYNTWLEDHQYAIRGEPTPTVRFGPSPTIRRPLRRSRVSAVRGRGQPRLTVGDDYGDTPDGTLTTSNATVTSRNIGWTAPPLDDNMEMDDEVEIFEG